MERSQTDAHDTNTATASNLHHRSASISSGSGGAPSTSRQSKRRSSNAAQHHSNSHSCSSPCHSSSPAPHYSDLPISSSHLHQHHGSQQHCRSDAHGLHTCSRTAVRQTEPAMSGSVPPTVSSLPSTDAISTDSGVATSTRQSLKGATPPSPGLASPGVCSQNSEAVDASGADGSPFPASSSVLPLRRTSGSQAPSLRPSDCTRDTDGFIHLQGPLPSSLKDKDRVSRPPNYNTISSPPLAAFDDHQIPVAYEIEPQDAGTSCITPGDQHFASQQSDQSDSAGLEEWPEPQRDGQAISAHDSSPIPGLNDQVRRSVTSAPIARSKASLPLQKKLKITLLCDSGTQGTQGLSSPTLLCLVARVSRSDHVRGDQISRKTRSIVQSSGQSSRSRVDSGKSTIGRDLSSSEALSFGESSSAREAEDEPAHLVLRAGARRRRIADSNDGLANSSAATSTSQQDFHHQPAPRSKRRRIYAGASNAETASCTSTTTLAQSHASANDAAPCDDAVGAVPADSCTAVTSHAATQGSHRMESTEITQQDRNTETDHKTVTTAHDGGWTSEMDPLAEPASHCGVLVELKRVAGHQTVSPAESLSGPSHRQSPRELLAEKTVASRAHAAHHLPASGRSRRGRLTRSLSLPNMHVKHDLNPFSRARHCLINPYRHLRLSDKALHKQQHKYARHSNQACTTARAAFCTPLMVPPITCATLLELDLHEIVKNPQLRHDIVYDPNVQFRPNYDGDRGKRKREACERYWTAVTREVETGCVCTAFDDNQVLRCTCLASTGNTRSGAGQKRDAMERPARGTLQLRSVNHPSRLSTLILELRAICLSILPNPVSTSGAPLVAMAASSSSLTSNGIVSLPSGPGRAFRVPNTFFNGPAAESSSHRTQLAEILDPTLISQQLDHGVLDISSLVQSVASILALHCAPPRKELIQQMVRVTQRGDVGQGLRMCFETLELMKLDIANHQLRSTRPWLVHTAVEFEARWFRDQISSGKLGRLDKTVSWLHRSWTDVTGSDLPRAMCHPANLLTVFNAGFMRLVFDPSSSLALGKSHASAHSSTSSSIPVPTASSSFNRSAFFPETFQFDAFRMTTFHNEVIDMSIVYMLLLLFRQLACSPAIATPSTAAGRCTTQVASAAAGSAQRYAEAMKSEIWCLLNEANAKPSAGSRSPTLPSGGTVAEQWAGVGKLGNPTWLSAVKSVLIQVAARAGAVWDDAFNAVCRNPRCTTTAESELLPPVKRVPNVKAMTLLDSWLSNQLSLDSSLMKLCIGKMKMVLECDVAEKVASEAKHASPTLAIHHGEPSPSPRRSSLSRSTVSSAAMVAERKRTATDGSENASEGGKGKRRKGEHETPVMSQGMEDVEDEPMEAESAVSQQTSSCASIAELSDRMIRPRGSPRRGRGSLVTMPHAVAAKESSSMSDEGLNGDYKSPTKLKSHHLPDKMPLHGEDWDALVTRAGLGAMKGELRSLGARLAQVATMNIKTFLPLYETIICCSEK